MPCSCSSRKVNAGFRRSRGFARFGSPTAKLADLKVRYYGIAGRHWATASAPEDLICSENLLDSRAKARVHRLIQSASHISYHGIIRMPQAPGDQRFKVLLVTKHSAPISGPYLNGGPLFDNSPCRSPCRSPVPIA